MASTTGVASLTTAMAAGEPALTFRRRHPVIWRLVRHRLGMIGLTILLCIALAAIFAPLVAPHDPMQQNLKARFLEPGADGYVLGADAFGRDILSRLVWGGRLSLSVGIIASVVSLGIGVPIGMLSGYRGGRFDRVAMRVVDMMLAFPYILLAIVIVGSLGPGFRNTLIAVAITNIPFYLRIIRGSVIAVRESPFIESARAIGAGDVHILRTAVFPAVLPYIIVSFTISVGWLILEAAGLSFLGLGAQPPTPEWGAMLAESRQYITLAPHTVFIPGLMILVTVVCLNMFGDALRDALDVTIKE